MPQARVTDALSDAGKAVMSRGFAAGWTAARIAQAVLDETGETVAERTVARRAAEWRVEVERRQSARERMTDLVAALRAGNTDASEMIQALAMDHLAEHPDALTGADPIELQGLALDAEKMRLKKRELDLRERAVTTIERRVKLLEDKERRLLTALDDKGEKLTPEQRLSAIREIYGLRASESSV